MSYYANWFSGACDIPCGYENKNIPRSVTGLKLVRKTEKAMCFEKKDNIGEYLWVPRSQCIWSKGVLTAPIWLLEVKGLYTGNYLVEEEKEHDRWL